MLIELDFELILRRAAIFRPNAGLVEAYAVEHFFGKAFAAVGKLFRVRKLTHDLTNLARVTHDVTRGAVMPQGKHLGHFDEIANLEGNARTAHGKISSLFLTSSIRRPSSSLVMTPRSRRVFAIAATQRS